MTVWRVDW